MSIYSKHIFICENMRTDGTRCCAAGASALPGGAVKFLRGLLKERGQHGKGRMRVNRAGCFDCCQQGPVLVVYPHGHWYRYQSEEDLREIFQQTLLQDKVVARLLL